MKTGLPLNYQMPSLRTAVPALPTMANPQPLKGDDNGSANSPHAAGAELINRSLLDTSRLNGMGGRLDLTV